MRRSFWTTPVKRTVKHRPLSITLVNRSSMHLPSGAPPPKPLVPQRYRVEFTASQQYVGASRGGAEPAATPDSRSGCRTGPRARDGSIRRTVAKAPAGGDEPCTQGQPISAPPRPRGQKALKSERSAPARVADAAALRSAPARVNRRYVPAGVRRTVWQRDEGRCTFEDGGGRRCSERAGLEIHHEHAFALGGPPTVENLRLLCQGPHALLAGAFSGGRTCESIVETRK